MLIIEGNEQASRALDDARSAAERAKARQQLLPLDAPSLLTGGDPRREWSLEAIEANRFR